MLDDYAGSSEWPVGYTLAWPMNLIFDTEDYIWAHQSRPLDTGHPGQPCDEGSADAPSVNWTPHDPTGGESVAWSSLNAVRGWTVIEVLDW
jgi:hypothetical protein